MKKNQLNVGKIINTHGIKGEIKVLPLTDDPARFEDLEWVYLSYNNQLKKLYIQSVRYQRNNIIIKFKNINSIDEIEKYKNCMLIIDRDMAVDLPENTYFIIDLIGVEVRLEDGEKLGKIIDVIETGSNDVYVIKPSKGSDILIPAIKQVIKHVDIEENIMIVKLLEGLINNEI